MTIAQQLEQKGTQAGRKVANEGKLEVARTTLQNGIDRNTVIQNSF